MSTILGLSPLLLAPRVFSIDFALSMLMTRAYRPDLISLVFSDVGSLTPEGVSQYLVGMFAG